MDIWRAVEVLNRRKWLILFSTVIAVVLTYGATQLTGAKWQASVRLMAPQTGGRATGTAGTGNNSQSTEYYEADSGGNARALQTLYTTILLSKEVVEPAYEKIREALPNGGTLTREVEFNVLGPRLYQIQVTTNKPEKSELLANALSESFIKQYSALATAEAQKVVDLLQRQLSVADKDLEIARAKYIKYSRDFRVFGNVEDDNLSARVEIETARSTRNGIAQELAVANARLSDSQRRLADLAPVVSKARPILNGPHFKSLSDELDRVTIKLATLTSRYGSSHPDVKEATIARDNLSARLKTAQATEDAIASYDEKVALRIALDRSVAELQPKILELQAQKTALDKQIATAENRALDAKGLSDPYGSIASEVTTKQEARSILVARLNASNLALDVAKRQNPMIILENVNPLNPPVNIMAGRTIKLVLISAICALIGCCAIIIALDSVDRRVKNLNEAEKSLPTQVLAAIPQPEAIMSYSTLARIAELNPRSLSSEAYRFLGLHLLASAGSEMRSLMVVSAKAEQGSTTTITNLAITLAQAGNRVVLVDANVRTAELHQVFETKNEFGFTDLLMDPTTSSFEKALLPTSVENLRIITSGSAPENPWELFRSSNLKSVSRRLRDIADYVLYDTPSGVMFTDALNLAPIVDGAILCVRALEATTGLEARLVDLISQNNVTVLGAVLNDVPVTMFAGYDNYRHYYAPALPPVSTLETASSKKQDALLIGKPNYDSSVADSSNSNGSSTQEGM